MKLRKSPQLVTFKEAMELLGEEGPVSRSYIDALVRKGRLTKHKNALGRVRFDVAEIEALIKFRADIAV